MTDEEILRKILAKAVRLGYVLDKDFDYIEMSKNRAYFSIIFSHDFAKAFWGYDNNDYHVKRVPFIGNILEDLKVEKWKYFLSVMILEEEPLKYLTRFLYTEK